MAKASGLPSIDVENETKKSVSSPKSKETPIVSPELGRAVVEVPVGYIPPGGYIPRIPRVDGRGFTREQSEMLLRLSRGCQDSETRLKNGRLVKTHMDVFRLFLERAMEAVS